MLLNFFPLFTLNFHLKKKSDLELNNNFPVISNLNHCNHREKNTVKLTLSGLFKLRYVCPKDISVICESNQSID